jgi:type II secretory pathway pseudopilin PulG
MIDGAPRDELGLSLVEAMFSIAILAIAALAIGMVLIGSFRQTTSAEQVLNAQIYGMQTGVAGTYSSASNIELNVSVSPGSSAQTTSIPDAVSVTTPVAPSAMTTSVATAPIVSSTSTPTWWMP